VRGIADIVATLRDIRGLPIIAPMIVLAGAASFWVGNSYQAQMPGFAHDLGHGDPGTAYSALLAADAAGALTAGLLLESGGGWLPTTVATALRLALLWATALVAFALLHTYALALLVLFAAGFFELSFSSIAMALVQIHAPDAARGRILGLFNMAALGLRAFSGVTVGLVGSLIGIHASLAGSAIAFAALITVLLVRRRARSTAGASPPAA
jgi:hypothetical protein